MPEPRLAPVEKLKIPPQSIEAEQSVLGGLLLAPAAWEQVADLLVEDDFYREDHRLIFRAIRGLHDRSRPTDAVTVTEWFESHGQADLIDGGAYIGQLVNSTPSAANIVAYADIVREKSILRNLIEVGTEVAAGLTVSHPTATDRRIAFLRVAVFPACCSRYIAGNPPAEFP